MPIYDGVVTVAEDAIPVIVELGHDVVRLSASGREVGEWRKGEYEIHRLGDSTFAIEAEDEILEFVPRAPADFAAAINGGLSKTELETAPEPETSSRPETASEPANPAEPGPEAPSGEAPPPKTMTMGLFYALCLATAGLAVWSIISLIL